MIFHYLSTKKFVIDKVPFEFGDSRESVRIRLGGNYKEDNLVIPLGDEEAPLILRRDIYDSLHSTGDYFFLNYDKNDLLKDLEIHRCEKVEIFDFSFDFGDEVDYIASGLSNYAPANKRGEGAYFFKNLHISIIDEMHMGGEEKSTLCYFYYASDVSHLG